jgi:hypothetical protein
MSTQVYWIRAPHHSDLTLDGYVGVSKNAQKRWSYGHSWAHRKGRHENQKLANAISKYGWDSLVKTVLVISDEVYCYDLERKLRPSDNIGWNLVSGGGKPPISKFRGEDYISPLKGIPRPTPWMIGRTPATAGMPVSDDTRAKLSAAKKGRKQTPEQIAKRVASRHATLAAQGRTR